MRPPFDEAGQKRGNDGAHIRLPAPPAADNEGLPSHLRRHRIEAGRFTEEAPVRRRLEPEAE